MPKRNKRKPQLTDERLHDVWNVCGLDYGENELAGFDKLVSSAVARCLKEDERSRAEIAAMLSSLLGEEVSVMMLDAYSSEARRKYPMPAHRFLTLIAMTRRFDILDAVLREVGGKALDRAEAKVFRVGKDYIASVNAAGILRQTMEELNSNPTV